MINFMLNFQAFLLSQSHFVHIKTNIYQNTEKLPKYSEHFTMSRQSQCKNLVEISDLYNYFLLKYNK